MDGAVETKYNDAHLITTTFRVPGMTCASCTGNRTSKFVDFGLPGRSNCWHLSGTVEGVLGPIPGVKQVDVALLLGKRVKIVHDSTIDAAKLKSELESSGIYLPASCLAQS